MSAVLAATFGVVGWVALFFAVIGLACGVAGGVVVTWLAQSSSAKPSTPWNRTLLPVVTVCGGVSVLGEVAGYLAGGSRVPAISDLLPAMLTIVGTIVSVLIAKDGTNRPLALSVALSLAVGTFIGATLGAQQRHFLKNTSDALQRRADLVVICKQQELRAKQILRIDVGIQDPSVDLKCDEYPRE